MAMFVKEAKEMKSDGKIWSQEKKLRRTNDCRICKKKWKWLF